MCGISGYFNFDAARPVDLDSLDRMRAVAAHRGPDDRGIYDGGRVGFAFNRLSIIDLAGGAQPMSNGDGTVWIVFNGEIYNFPELRANLQARGHRFRTKSDTETIIHAWQEFGEECVAELRGMFSFVLWDSRKQVLFGARDRLGIKPFYYYQNKETFAFASEIKALLELSDAPREPNVDALDEYLRCRYVIAPRTMFSGIHKLPPGHTILVDASGVRIRRYWDIPIGETADVPEARAVEELNSLLEESMRMHLLSDVPLGTFLSGGIDSTAVLALMARLGSGKIKTFSVGDRNRTRI